MFALGSLLDASLPDLSACVFSLDHDVVAKVERFFLENTFICSLLKRDGDPEVTLSYKTDTIDQRVDKYLQADVVFIPINIEKCHWYLAVVNAKKCEVHVLDSMGLQLLDRRDLKTTATRVYCFIHQVPVCGECICFPEHHLCVVKNYAEWVVNSDYDWPQHCSSCNSVLEAGSEETTRLGCLHVMHTKCLISHIQCFPTQTAPAGYVCPSCSTPIWPPSSIKDTGSRLHSKLKEAIVQTGLEKNVFGNHFVAMPKADTRTPPAFASDPLKHPSSSGESNGANTINSAKDATLPSTLLSKEDKYPAGMYSSATPSHVEPEIVEIDGPSPITTQFPEQESNFIRSPSPHGPGAMTRKGANHVERQNSEIFYYADDEDGNRKKYTKRGTFRHKFLRMLLPFWSSALPTLPVTAPPKKENDAAEGRLRHQRSRMDPTKILLAMAIMACIATMGILYYRLSQRSLFDSFIEDEPQ